MDENQKPNENLGAEVDAAKKFFEQCFEDFIAFRTKISPQVLELTERIKNLKMISLKDEEIRAAFDETVDSAEDELDVTAMKLNRKAEEYIPQFKALLERGVKIKIFYGIGEEDSDENHQTRATAYKLKKIFRKYPNFKMKRADTHAKIFICDEKFFGAVELQLADEGRENLRLGRGGSAHQRAKCDCRFSTRLLQLLNS